ncbi:MAG TPA: LysR family transcriptional regulator [Steroidobacteraceae bacterium]|jgi:DNA-binding transcriptional LysR family regulator
MDRLTQLELFVQIAKAGSVSKAAEVLRLSNPAATRLLVALEERLSVRLVERTTRRLWLTEAGQKFLERCQTILGDLQDAESSVYEISGEPVGTLRVTSSLSFAINHIGPLIPEFHRRYPKLNIEVITANRYLDFIEAGIDVAIRTREHEPPDSGIVVRPLAETRRMLCASPGYLSRRGMPRHPDDLQDHHDLLLYVLSKDPHELHFTKGSERHSVSVRGILESNDGQVLRSAALLGLGIMVQPLYITYDDVVAGRLMPVLEDWELPRLTINIAYQSRVHMPAKVRAFIDFMIEHFERHDFTRKWKVSWTPPGIDATKSRPDPGGALLRSAEK